MEWREEKNAIFRLNGEEIEAGDGRSITIPHHSGTVIGEVISSNRVGQIMVMATMGQNSADSVIVNCNPGVIELTPDPGNEIDFIYKWINLKAQLTFEGEPLQGHDIVLSCQTLTQSDDTFEETSLGSSVDDSRFLTAFIWFGLDEGKFQLLTTGKDGICNFRYQVRGFNKEFNFMSMDQHVAKRLFE